MAALAAAVSLSGPPASAASAAPDMNRVSQQYQRLLSLAAKFPAAYGAVTFDENRQRLVVHVKEGASAAALRASASSFGGEIDFVPSAVSHQQLEKTNAYRTWAGSLASSINYATVLDSEESALIFVDDHADEVRNLATQQLGFTPKVVQAHWVPTTAPEKAAVTADSCTYLNRRNDSNPYAAGAPMFLNSGCHSASQDANCTLGFAMHKGTVGFASTAGHCGVNDNERWSNGPNTFVRFSSDYVSGTDVDGAILARTNGTTFCACVWLGDRITTRYVQVTAKQTTYLAAGSAVYFSGANGGQVYGVVQAQNTSTPCDAVSGRLHQGVVTYTWSGSAADGEVMHGDSGGPVVRWNTSTSAPDDVVAVGLIECRAEYADHTYAGYAMYTPTFLLEQVSGALVTTN